MICVSLDCLEGPSYLLLIINAWGILARQTWALDNYILFYDFCTCCGKLWGHLQMWAWRYCVASGRQGPGESWVLGCALSFLTREQYFLDSRGHCCIRSPLWQPEGCADFRRVGVQTGAQIVNRLTIPYRDGEGALSSPLKTSKFANCRGSAAFLSQARLLEIPQTWNTIAYFFFLKSNLIEHR